MASHVIVYKGGPLHLSVCAPADMSGAEVAASVNRACADPTLVPWHVSTDEKFATGESNPCPCDVSPSARKHWLLG